VINETAKNDYLSLISKLDGPVLVTGAGGFIGSALFKSLLAVRSDVYGVARKQSWRLSNVEGGQTHFINLENPSELINCLNEIKPRTIFNLSAHGAYPDQNSFESIVRINLNSTKWIADWCSSNQCGLVHAGTSSEYGTNCTAPSEMDSCKPNSAYAVTKLAATQILELLCDSSKLAVTVLRLYSVYGPMEEPRRLIPTLIRLGQRSELPPFSPREVTRDFVFIDDVVNAFIVSAVSQIGTTGFRIFNICTGEATSMEQVANLTRELFQIEDEPIFGPALRRWDLSKWFGNPSLANQEMNWYAQSNFLDGLKKTYDWYSIENNAVLLESNFNVSASSLDKKKISAIIACYKDAQAIPHMHSRLVKIFNKIDVDYEVIFVNDCSPDNTMEVIEEISRFDSKVIGISHSRNFGSQAAFVSGMNISTGDACVLLDGDLQDPPELIEDFVANWEKGFDVVFGQRIGREAPMLMRFAYKAFYRVLAKVSTFVVPLDAGDFSLMSRRVVDQLLMMPERELFLRAARAYVGHRQIGISYVRPERMFGTSTNNLKRNFGWAMRGIIAVGRAPLNLVTFLGSCLFGLSLLAIIGQVLIRIFEPSVTPPGLTSVLTIITFFGSINLLALSIIGSYVGRILDESKRRPRFIAEKFTSNGRTHDYDQIDTGVSTKT
jgi:nucleoside-diphosphate-sugar epimerase/glycosyltransferase involved in cell wall biosynthesis